MDKEIKERIVEYINSTKKTRTEFASKISMTPNHLSVVLNNNEKGVTFNLVKELAKLGVNLNWLISGIGSMLVNDSEDSSKLKEEVETLKKQLFGAEEVIKFCHTALLDKTNGKELNAK